MVRKSGSEAALPDGATNAPTEFSREFLQTVVDALPEAVVVIDRDYNIVLANRAAHVHQGCLKCYQCFHHKMEPCDDGDCPVQLVIETKAPVRVYHTHYDSDQKEVSIAVDAAPIFDEAGEVIYMIEACRDVTERTLARRLSRIGNHHMRLGPLLAEYASEIRGYTLCSQVHIHVFDEKCDVCGCDDGNEGRDVDGVGSRQTADDSDCTCVRFLSNVFERELPPATEDGSFRFDRFSEFLSGLPEASRSRLGACVWPHCESVALVPIPYANNDIGLLHVADPRPDAISAVLVASLERLSSELGAAIHRVRVEEALQAVRGDLEARVRERTEDLTKANESLQREIAERGRLERQLLRATVREQQRIGQELHDGLGQELTGISYMAQNLVVKLKQQQWTEVEFAEELAQSVRTVIGQTQQIVRGLVPLEIGTSDLEPALESLTISVAKQTGLSCDFRSKNDGPFDLDDDEAIQIYRIAQEAITNAVKHSKGRSIEVTLRVSGDALSLEVSDDGVGVRSSASDGPGCGLRSMRYRARAIGGELKIAPQRAGGTSVTCRVVRR